jgi:hypothetical protein
MTEKLTRAMVFYHKLQMQPNAGKVPPSIKEWKRKHDGSHAIMATALVKKGGTKDDVQEGLEEAVKGVKI